MSNHYRKFVKCMTGIYPCTCKEIVSLDFVFQAARRSERLGNKALALALVDASNNLNGAIKQAVIQAANDVAGRVNVNI